MFCNGGWLLDLEDLSVLGGLALSIPSSPLDVGTMRILCAGLDFIGGFEGFSRTWYGLAGGRQALCDHKFS